MLTVTGQDCAAGKSVGCFVSQAVDSRGQEVIGRYELAGDRYKVAIQRSRIRYRRSDK